VSRIWALVCIALVGMEQTWIAIVASLLMGLGAACVFVFSVKRDYFRDLEETKYQVFWSDLEEVVDSAKPTQERPNG
jgi:nitrogen fixation-related uncharacterized protein